MSLHQQHLQALLTLPQLLVPVCWVHLIHWHCRTTEPVAAAAAAAANVAALMRAVAVAGVYQQLQAR